MAIFESASIYIQSASSLQDKIVCLDNIIAALELEALDAAGNMGITEYQLDDGQTKIRTNYRSTTQIAAAIDDFERIKQRYVNRLNGHSFRLVDWYSNR